MSAALFLAYGVVLGMALGVALACWLLRREARVQQRLDAFGRRRTDWPDGAEDEDLPLYLRRQAE